MVDLFYLEDQQVYTEIIYVFYNEIYENREEFLKKIRECDFKNNQIVRDLIKNAEEILTEIQNIRSIYSSTFWVFG